MRFRWLELRRGILQLQRVRLLVVRQVLVLLERVLLKLDWRELERQPVQTLLVAPILFLVRTLPLEQIPLVVLPLQSASVRKDWLFRMTLFT